MRGAAARSRQQDRYPFRFCHIGVDDATAIRLGLAATTASCLRGA